MRRVGLHRELFVLHLEAYYEKQKGQTERQQQVLNMRKCIQSKTRESVAIVVEIEHEKTFLCIWMILEYLTSCNNNYLFIVTTSVLTKLYFQDYNTVHKVSLSFYV